MKNGMIMKDKFKIVYVAPMKALAAEMTSTFSKRLAPLGQDGTLLASELHAEKPGSIVP